MLQLWHDPIYTAGIHPEARFPRERYDLVRAGLSGLDCSHRIQFREPDGPLPLVDLAQVHCANYVDRFLSGSLPADVRRRIGLEPWIEAIVERTLILTHGTVSATRWSIENREVAGNLGGGTHHAYRDFGSGYCIFNDLAVSARIAQRDYGCRRILILDLDVHQGDGTAALFEGDQSVRTVSFHCIDNFPDHKTRSDLDVAFPKEAGDDEYLKALERVLSEESSRELPDVVLFQAGVDSLSTDRLGHLSLTQAGLRRRNDLVLSFAENYSLPLVVTMGGGYGEPLETSVRAHVDLFRQAAGLELFPLA